MKKMSCCLKKVGNDIIEIKAKDPRRDAQTGTCIVLVFSSTGNLTAKLRLCVGARVMVTGKIIVADRLINGSCGTIFYLFLGRKPLLGTISVKFDDPFAGNFMKTYGMEVN